MEHLPPGYIREIVFVNVGVLATLTYQNSGTIKSSWILFEYVTVIVRLNSILPRFVFCLKLNSWKSMNIHVSPGFLHFLIVFNPRLGTPQWVFIHNSLFGPPNELNSDWFTDTGSIRISYRKFKKNSLVIAVRTK